MRKEQGTEQMAETGSPITLGIPCYNESVVIEETLNEVGSLERKPERVICVDDGSTDNTAEIIRNHTRGELITHGENRGRGEARNTILEATETPLLAMIDADIHPRRGWLKTLEKTIAETGAAAVGGRVIVPGDSPVDRWRRFRLKVNDYDEAGAVTHVAGGNVLFRTVALEEVGGWPDLQSTEDKTVCFRLGDAGNPVYFTPNAVVEHVGDETPRSVLRNLWRWHFESRNEPDSLVDLPSRLVYHTAKGATYCVEDITSGRWWALPITARLPLEFFWEDVRRIG